MSVRKYQDIPKYRVTWSVKNSIAPSDQSKDAMTPEEVGTIVRQVTLEQPYVEEIRIAIKRPVRLCGSLGGHACYLPGEEPDPLEFDTCPTR